jgi:hypothetical protein
MIKGEAQKGFNILKGIVEKERILRLEPPQQLQGRFAYLLVAGAFGKTWDFVLSAETLSDLPNMPEYIKAAQFYSGALAKRMRNPAVNAFYCKSGKAISIDIEWPLESLPMRAASAVGIRVSDIRTQYFAHCYVVVTHQQSIFDLKSNPFLIQSSAVNSVRSAIDLDEITFYANEAHPVEQQKVMLELNYGEPTTAHKIEDFLREKIFYLAFRTTGGKKKAWIADPWDAEYLVCKTADLLQAAEILEAKEELILDETHEFASAGKSLLANAHTFDLNPKKPTGTTFVDETPQWDVFISHATEDKEAFVRPLAELLIQRGVRVWFDEFTLTIGDSLRRSIDRGLSGSRFGVVVLSNSFFSKDWPQRELDGLMAKETSGGKVILPIWHNITFAEIRVRSPLLADRLAVSSSEGLNRVAEAIISVLENPKPGIV